MNDYTDLILEKFSSISAIPRQSGHEEKIKEWIKSWAQERKWQTKEDEVGNICVYVPARNRKAEPVVIQGHLDMVCEKTPDSSHDFAKDGLKLRRKGDWLDAENTTLGADNGIAIAMAMVLAETEQLDIPPLELLFTVDEETGLTGASGLDASMISGQILLNIDSEDEGVFTVGCAGGNNVHVEMPLRRVNSVAKDAAFYSISVSGARGGHSGIDIHKQRANAIRVLSRALLHLKKNHQIFVETISGGSAHNAIPREASAVVAVERCEQEALEKQISELAMAFSKEFKSTDPDLKLELKQTNGKKYFTQGATDKLLNLLHSIPHGVEAMSTELEGVVDSSGNLAMIQTKGDSISILTSHRSSNMSRLDSLSQRVEAIGHLAEAKVRITDAYPPWEPDWDAPLLAKSQAIYRELFDKEPVVEVIHAGLECGIIGEKKPGMQMISFGPNIEDAHSPDERLQISDVQKVWTLLVSLVQNVT
jgi:dipeptidase D